MIAFYLSEFIFGSMLPLMLAFFFQVVLGTNRRMDLVKTKSIFLMDLIQHFSEQKA